MLAKILTNSSQTTESKIKSKNIQFPHLHDVQKSATTTWKLRLHAYFVQHTMLLRQISMFHERFIDV